MHYHTGTEKLSGFNLDLTYNIVYNKDVHDSVSQGLVLWGKLGKRYMLETIDKVIPKIIHLQNDLQSNLISMADENAKAVRSYVVTNNASMMPEYLDYLEYLKKSSKPISFTDFVTQCSTTPSSEN